MVRSLGKNPLTNKVKVRFEPGSKYGSTTRRRQKLDYLLGLGVLIVEMSSDERKAPPWIFFGVNGDQKYTAWVWFFGFLL